MGTANFVTNSHGDTTQFFLNLPFGETMLEQMDGSYNNPYKFNGKELDEDTGLYYYGARYYNPRLSIWYGVDPLAVHNPVMEKEFYGDGQHNGGVYFWGNLNPYTYTYQNPIVFVDPNGKQSKFMEVLNDNAIALETIKQYRGDINKTAQKYNISSQAIASIIFQEKSAGVRGSLANIYSKYLKADKTTSLGLGEIQVQKAIELDNKEGMGLDIKNQQHIDWTIQSLEDPKMSIDYIGKNIKDMEEYVGRPLSVQEVTFGHNAGKKSLKDNLPIDKQGGNRVSKRSINYQGAIKDALNGKLNFKSDAERNKK